MRPPFRFLLFPLFLPANGENTMNPNTALPRSTPEAQGVSSQALLNFIDAVESGVRELHSVMLVRHGQVVAEGWWAPYRAEYPHVLFSLSKSFTSTAIGMAVAEGLLTVNDRVIDFFPEFKPRKVSENLAQMRVRQLLAMCTGHDHDTTLHLFQAKDGNWVRAFLARPVKFKPGTHFLYNTGATYMLSAILQKITGITLLEYLTPRLFEPLGIEGAAWDSCPRGINTGGFGLRLKTEDIAKFGQLYLQKGVWNGQRLLAEEWIAEASARQVSNGCIPESDWDQGYGYQFWRCRHNIYRGDGAFGQYCIIMPEQDAVLAITAGVANMQQVLDLVWDHLLPGMRPGALPANPALAEKLRARLASLALPLPAGQVSSPLAKPGMSRAYALAENEQKLTGLSYDFTDDACRLTVTGPFGAVTTTFGLGSWLKGSSRLFADREEAAETCAVWKAEDVLELTVRYVHTPFYWTITNCFAGSEVKVQVNVNVAFGPTKFPELSGHAV